MREKTVKKQPPKKTSSKVVKKITKKKMSKNVLVKKSAKPLVKQERRLSEWFQSIFQWIELGRPALVAIMVALAWFGQEQFLIRHLTSGLWLWCGAAVAGLLAFTGKQYNPFELDEIKNRKIVEPIALAVAVIAAFIIRVWAIDSHPNGYFFDEATNALVGLRIINDANYLPIFGPPDAPAPTLYHYLNGVAQFFGGANILATKAVPVLLGTATVGMFYFLMRRIVSWPVALTAAIMLAFMRWHINFSRINFIGIATPLFAVSSAYFLLRGMETKNRWHMALSGLAVAMGLYTYYASNLIPFVLGPYMVMQLAWEKAFLKKQWKGLLLFLIVSFAVFAPLGYFALTNKNQFFSRNGQVLIFNHVPPDQAVKAFWLNVKTTLLMFNFYGDTNGRHNIPEVPMLDPVSGLLFGIGLIWSFVNSYKKHAFLVLLWLLVALVPGYLTIEAPQSYRCIGAIVPVMMIMTLGLERLWQTARELVQATRFKQWLWVSLIGLIAFIGVRNSIDYFDRQAKHAACWSEFSAREFAMGNMIRDLGKDYHTYISAGSFNYPTIRYLGYPDMEAEPFRMTKSIPTDYYGIKNIVYMLLPIHDGALELLRYAYPGGTEKIHHSPYDFNLFTSYSVSQDEIKATRGLQARYKDGNGKLIERREGKNVFQFTPSGLELTFPVSVEWTGSVRIATFGSYAFQTKGLSGVQVQLDGKVINIKDAMLAQGQHELRITGIITAPNQKVGLYWKHGSGMWNLIPTAVLSPRSDRHGLIGTYWRSKDWTGNPVLQRIDPLMSLLGADFPMNAPFSTRWSGKITIPKKGDYIFGVLPNEFASLYIDDKLIIENKTPDQYQEGDIYLKSGQHTIRIDYQKSIGAYPRLVLYWTEPGKARTKVPFTVLSPE